MIPAIRKSGYAETEPPNDSQNEQENPPEIAVQAGGCREGNREATAVSGQNRQTDFVVCRVAKKSEVRQLRAFRACIS